eukprot:365885-Chlamydomonas_euryale.AAC.4
MLKASSPSRRSPLTRPTSAGVLRLDISLTTTAMGVRPGLMSDTLRYSDPKSMAIMEADALPASDSRCTNSISSAAGSSSTVAAARRAMAQQRALYARAPDGVGGREGHPPTESKALATARARLRGLHAADRETADRGRLLRRARRCCERLEGSGHVLNPAARPPATQAVAHGVNDAFQEVGSPRTP